jgi:hypothetical protein
VLKATALTGQRISGRKTSYMLRWRLQKKRLQRYGLSSVNTLKRKKGRKCWCLALVVVSISENRYRYQYPLPDPFCDTGPGQSCGLVHLGPDPDYRYLIKLTSSGSRHDNGKVLPTSKIQVTNVSIFIKYFNKGDFQEKNV